MTKPKTMNVFGPQAVEEARRELESDTHIKGDPNLRQWRPDGRHAVFLHKNATQAVHQDGDKAVDDTADETRQGCEDAEHEECPANRTELDGAAVEEARRELESDTHIKGDPNLRQWRPDGRHAVFLHKNATQAVHQDGDKAVDDTADETRQGCEDAEHEECPANRTELDGGGDVADITQTERKDGNAAKEEREEENRQCAESGEREEDERNGASSGEREEDMRGCVQKAERKKSGPHKYQEPVEEDLCTLGDL
uniref:Uncharacterized protein n=1 Tax=Branchiostoma floridae TaxID=7739 RepID=C3YQ62_BRAFL|eukprot:XP_002601554.1 hypothetical protein BRAFLDRAFT_95790 [Branchiostoma floridae]